MNAPSIRIARAVAATRSPSPLASGRPRGRRQDAALGRPRRHADDRPALAEREPHQQHQPARLRVPGRPRQEARHLIPALAESWKQVNPTTWRVQAAPGRQVPRRHAVHRRRRRVQLRARARRHVAAPRLRERVGHPEEDRRLHRRVHHQRPEPDRARASSARSTSCRKAWCEKNRATKPQNYTQKEDMITAHQANGTGPYMLKSREPDVKTVLVKNPNWWGIKDGPLRRQRRRGRSTRRSSPTRRASRR